MRHKCPPSHGVYGLLGGIRKQLCPDFRVLWTDIQPQGLVDLQAAAIKQREQGRVPLGRPGFPFSDVIQEGQRIGYGLVSR